MIPLSVPGTIAVRVRLLIYSCIARPSPAYRSGCCRGGWSACPMLVADRSCAGGLHATLVIVAAVAHQWLFAADRRPAGARPALTHADRSSWLCVGFIEFVRGVPLITVLFMASVMLPLFLPERRGPSTSCCARWSSSSLFVGRLYCRGGPRRPAGDPKGQFEARRRASG